MQAQSTDVTSLRDQRAAMVRVFGGTALAFVALLVVALLVRPDLMHAAVDMVVAMMPSAPPR